MHLYKTGFSGAQRGEWSAGKNGIRISKRLPSNPTDQ